MKESSVVHQFGEIGPYVVHLFSISEEEEVVSEALLVKYEHQSNHPFCHLIYLETEIKQRRQGLATKNLSEINDFLIKEGMIGLLLNFIPPTSPSYLIYEKNGWEKISNHPDWMMFNKLEAISVDEIDKMVELLVTEQGDESLGSIEVRLSSYGV